MEQPITQVLEAAAEGDEGAQRRMYETVYAELHRIARSERRRWRGNDTINTTALIHEAYLKLLGADGGWSNRTHFFATAARAMRQVLVSYARERAAEKRGGGVANVTLDGDLLAHEDAPEDVLSLDRALSQLEAESQRACHVVECRFFAGMTLEETAEAAGISLATVKREWLTASVRLHELLGGA